MQGADLVETVPFYERPNAAVGGMLGHTELGLGHVAYGRVGTLPVFDGPGAGGAAVGETRT